MIFFGIALSIGVVNMYGVRANSDLIFAVSRYLTGKYVVCSTAVVFVMLNKLPISRVSYFYSNACHFVICCPGFAKACFHCSP